ncbi:MAG: arginine--tRNA ligase, partial [Holosporaceae bacterium]|nr:arginine--tRNA ligase [Holosporaceae bacterium]
MLFLRYRRFIEQCIDVDFRELVSIDLPKESSFGDFSTNIAMILAKKLKRSPMELAEEIAAELRKNDQIEKVEVKKPGFINLFVPRDVFLDHIPDVLEQNFGKLDLGKGRSINIEYVSANPTGPIHAGHVRCAVSGDVLARLLNFVGYKVVKEFYINDAGRQVEVLARSLHYRYLEQLGRAQGDFPANCYPGEYLVDTAKKIVAQRG